MKFSLYIVLGNVGARYSHDGNSGLKYSNKLCAFQAIHTGIFNWEQILIKDARMLIRIIDRNFDTKH